MTYKGACIKKDKRGEYIYIDGARRYLDEQHNSTTNLTTRQVMHRREIVRLYNAKLLIQRRLHENK